LGFKLNLSEGAVGSVLAAVGTALPETIIPVIAIVFGNGGGTGHEIGIGAILGAPLMLSTLAMFITGVAVVGFKNRRIHGLKVRADFSSMSRDLSFFLVVFGMALICGLIPESLKPFKNIIALALVVLYVWYVIAMVSQERDVEADIQLPRCYFAPKHCPPSLAVVLVQVLFALLLIVFGANVFVDSITELAQFYAVPAFVLSIIIAPIATELPEKFNSIIWISREKDTLALGNITGAMVFQGSLIPALGIAMTEWMLTPGALLSGLLAITSAALLLWQLRRQAYISALSLLFSGSFYMLFIVAVMQGIVR
jgi:cation:H+ antiporter